MPERCCNAVGEAGKFAIVPLLLNIGSGIGLLAIVSLSVRLLLVCHCQCQCQSWIYTAHKRKASNALVR